MPGLALSITESAAFTALRAFLLSIYPAGVEVIRGSVNRTPEPGVDDFIVMEPTLRERLETNTDAYADCVFTGSIAGAVLTVSALGFGTIKVGQTVFGTGVATGTTITALGTGTGGAGTYTVSTAQAVGSAKLASGTQTILQPTQLTVQLDFHGANSADYVQTFTTVFRDDYAVQGLASSGVDIAPLYTSEPRLLPFLNGEQQIEFRWSVDAVMQVNPVVTIPLQFADSLSVGLTDVDVVYPPS